MNIFSCAINEYAVFIRWLLSDSLWREKSLTVAVLVSSVMGVGFQIAVFGLVVIYAGHFASGESISLVGYSIDPRTSLELLAGGSLAVVLLLSFSALFIYYSQCTILRMSREYEEFCTKRVFQLLGQKGSLDFRSVSGEEGEPNLFRLVKADSRFAGRVLRMLLPLIVPGIKLIVSIVVLVYLEGRLSIIVAGLGAVLFFYQYRVSRLGAQYSIRFEQLAPAATAEYKMLVQHCKHTLGVVVTAETAGELFSKGPVRKQLDAYVGRLRAVENSKLVSGLFTAVVIGIILLVMGGSIIREGAGWDRLLVYVVALRFAMVSLQTVFSTITSINRFYPQVRRYFAFVRSMAGQNRERYPVANSYTLELGNNGVGEFLDGSVHQFEIKRGVCMAMVTPLDLNRYTLAGLCESLLSPDEPAVLGALYAASFASFNYSCPINPLRQALGLSSQATWEDLRGCFLNDEWWRLAREQLPKSLDKPIKVNQWKQVEPKLKFILSLISMRLNECSWVFIQAEGLRRLDPEVAHFYLALFDDAVCVVVHSADFGLVGSFNEDVVAVTDENCLLGLGDTRWFFEIKEQLSELMLRKGKSSGKMSGGIVGDGELGE
ncbi:ABC transporter ATP-binding protein [Candidatus Kaiserbacteria bacterium]|nr:ABC transporter ATP-binding protein [Candidatus Kaiserbacteria bacterium]